MSWLGFLRMGSFQITADWSWVTLGKVLPRTRGHISISNCVNQTESMGIQRDCDYTSRNVRESNCDEAKNPKVANSADYINDNKSGIERLAAAVMKMWFSPTFQQHALEKWSLYLTILARTYPVGYRTCCEILRAVCAD
jgi:hypothetical protein